MARSRCPSMLSLALLLLFLLATQALHLPFDYKPPGPSLEKRVILDNEPLTREMSLVISIDESEAPWFSPALQRPVRGAHVAVEFGGTSADGVTGVDGPIRIEVAVKDPGTPKQSAFIRALDFGPQSWQRTLSPAGRAGFSRLIVPSGQTTITNRQLLDEQTGRGLVLDVLDEDDVYRTGQGEDYNGCILFAGRLMEAVMEDESSQGADLEGNTWLTDMPVEAQEAINAGIEQSQNMPSIPITIPIASIHYERWRTMGPDRGLFFYTVFDVANPNGIVVLKTNHPASWFPAGTRLRPGAVKNFPTLKIPPAKNPPSKPLQAESTSVKPSVAKSTQVTSPKGPDTPPKLSEPKPNTSGQESGIFTPARNDTAVA